MNDVESFQYRRKTLLQSHKMRQLQDETFRHIYRTFKSIWVSAMRSTLENEAIELAHHNFKKRLKSVPKWNQHMIDEEYERILEETKSLVQVKGKRIDKMERLIHGLIKLTVEICMDPNGRTVNIRVPTGADFFHVVYTECARSFYEKPHLFDQRMGVFTTIQQTDFLHAAFKIIQSNIERSIMRYIPDDTDDMEDWEGDNVVTALDVDENYERGNEQKGGDRGENTNTFMSNWRQRHDDFGSRNKLSGSGSSTNVTRAPKLDSTYLFEDATVDETPEVQEKQENLETPNIFQDKGEGDKGDTGDQENIGDGDREMERSERDRKLKPALSPRMKERNLPVPVELNPEGDKIVQQLFSQLPPPLIEDQQAPKDEIETYYIPEVSEVERSRGDRVRGRGREREREREIRDLPPRSKSRTSNYGDLEIEQDREGDLGNLGIPKEPLPVVHYPDHEDKTFDVLSADNLPQELQKGVLGGRGGEEEPPMRFFSDDEGDL